MSLAKQTDLVWPKRGCRGVVRGVLGRRRQGREVRERVRTIRRRRRRLEIGRKVEKRFRPRRRRIIEKVDRFRSDESRLEFDGLGMSAVELNGFRLVSNFRLLSNFRLIVSRFSSLVRCQLSRLSYRKFSDFFGGDFLRSVQDGGLGRNSGQL